MGSAVVDGVIHGIKMTAILALAAAFMVVIIVLVQLLVEFVIPPVIPEVFGLLSCCLPFNAQAVFSAVGGATVTILAFMIAKKIFDLSSWGVSAA